MSPSSPPAVGIDLGTTNSLAAVVRGGRPEVIRDATGAALVPSCLHVAADGTVTVGAAAKARALAEPDRTVFSIKRLIGRSLADLSGASELFPHPLTETDAGGRKVLRVEIGGRSFTPEELSALILTEVRRRAGNPTRAVVTVPAYFDDAQRQATRDAGRIAGLDVLRVVNEPTAAALAYGLDRSPTGPVVVYDLGGGTFDCSVLRLTDGVFRVLATGGDTALGGDDFDRAFMAHLAGKLGLDTTGRDPRLLQTLRDAAERAKFALSDGDATSVAVGGRSVAVSRAEFEALISPLVDRTLSRCKAALRDAELTAADVAEVVLVGGSTRVPLVRRRVEEFFGRPPHADLNPDEVVALGAAVQADILTGGRRDFLLLDVVPLSLGIETLGGAVDKVVHRNSPVPCRATTRYSTSADNQTAIVLTIYQGERELARDCKRLGTFTLRGLPPMPAQMPQVDVTFLVDADGLLTVSAVERRSGQAASVEVRAAHGLSDDEVERLVLESVEHAHADFAARRLVELKAKAAGDLRHAERGLREAGDRLTADQRAEVEAAAAALRAAVATDDLPAVDRATTRFAAATQPLAELLMNAAAAALFVGKSDV
jgi:molecular chaperone DnaK (HSP70)